MDYKRILRRSWKIAKTHKLLWVFGMALAAFSGGNPQLNFGGSDGQGLSEFFKETPIEEVPRETSQILGAYTDSIIEVFTNIPIAVWIILGVSIILAILAAIAISLFIRNWAKGSLIALIHDTEEQKPISLRSGSLHGISVVKRYIYLHIVPWLLFTGAILLLIFLTGVSLALIESETARTLILIFSILIAGVIGIIGGILLVLTIILAEQLVIRKNLSARKALKQGFHLAKKYLGKMLAMGAINLGIGCALGCATIILLILLAGIIIVAFAINREAGLVVAVIAGIPILAFVLLSILIRGIYTVFKISTWTLLTREIEKKEREGADNA